MVFLLLAWDSVPAILSAALGRVATVATGRLLKVVGLRATAAAQRVHLIETLSKGWRSFHCLASAAEAKQTGKPRFQFLNC